MQILAQIGRLLRAFSLGQRIVLTVVVLGAISAVTALVLWANRPEYDLLYSKLDPVSASKIVSDLRSSKIKYRLEDRGTTIYVPAKDVSEMRLKFAEAGYVGDSVSGYEIFDKSNIGMTTFMQRLNMRRALEGELTRTINQFPEVRRSRVHLVIPEKKLFEEEERGSASVVLYLTPGAYLNPGQIRGISALVSNSVEGINPEDVVVVDSDGKLLSDHRGEGAVNGAGDRWDLRHAVESNLQNKVTEIVEGIVGYQNAVVKINVDLNFEQTEKTIEEFDPDKVVILSEERHSESSTGEDTSQYSRENVITNYELNKTVEHYVANTGNIERLTIAVLVNGRYVTKEGEDGKQETEYVPRTAQELKQIASLVKSAIGYDDERGDVIEVQNLQFDQSTLESEKAYFAEIERKEKWAKIINGIFIGLGILVAFVIVRGLLKSTSSILQLPAEGKSLLVGVREPALSLGEGLPSEEEEIPEDIFIKRLSPEARAKLRAKDRMTEEVLKFTQQKPEDASKLVRSWLAGGGSKGNA